MPEQKHGCVEPKGLLYASCRTVSVTQMCLMVLAILIKRRQVEIEQLKVLGATGPIDVPPMLSCDRADM